MKMISSRVRCRFCGDPNCMGFKCLDECGCRWSESTKTLTVAGGCLNPDHVLIKKVTECEECGWRDFHKANCSKGNSKMDISSIVSPSAPTTENADGGKQSDVPVRFDLIDARALFEMAKVLDHGAKKYGADNWRLIPVQDHLNHLLMHVYAYLAGDETDDHLSHALCRATFALGVKLDDV